jgi:hypothetical protein
MAASAERSLADLTLRKSGIRVMDSLPWGAYLCVLRDQRGPARYGYFLFRGRIGKQRILRMGGFRSNLSGGCEELGASRNLGVAHSVACAIISSGRGRHMPRFFFHATPTRGASHDESGRSHSAKIASRTDEYPDNEGVVLASTEEAISYGTRVARELAAEGKWKRYVIAVMDETGNEIARIPIAQS